MIVDRFIDWLNGNDMIMMMGGDYGVDWWYVLLIMTMIMTDDWWLIMNDVI